MKIISFYSIFILFCFCLFALSFSCWNKEEGDDDTLEKYENTDALCSDGVDNDGDGYIDCDDWNCKDTTPCATTEENTDSKCSDGIDNDGNGFTDCDDWSCSKNHDITVCPREDTASECTNNEDDDDDGHIDCDDWDCGWMTECGGTGQGEWTDETCSDGIDNDADGYIDCDDHNCEYTTSVTVCD